MNTVSNRVPASFPVRRMDYNFKTYLATGVITSLLFTHYFTGLSTLFLKVNHISFALFELYAPKQSRMKF